MIVFFKKFFFQKLCFLKMVVCKTIALKNIFIKIVISLTILNNDPLLMIVNNEPLFTIINDDPTLTIVIVETDLKGICTYHLVVFKKISRSFSSPHNFKTSCKRTFNKIPCNFSFKSDHFS